MRITNRTRERRTHDSPRYRRAPSWSQAPPRSQQEGQEAAIGLSAGLLTALLATIGIVGAQESEAVLDLIKAVDTIWVIVAGVLVFFMQAGFGMLEAGFVRVKNTPTS